MRIDAHQHYWIIDRGDYLWMDDNPALEKIRRDFVPEHLEAQLHSAQIDKTVVVQAAATLEETHFLLSQASDP